MQLQLNPSNGHTMPSPPSDMSVSTKTKVVLVTPALAKEYLKKNRTNNRPLGQRTVQKYAAAMKRGEWELTHEGIGFDLHGHLADGQHRMHAVVESGVACEFMVTFGLSDRAFTVIGQGRSRTAADLLHIADPSLGYVTHLAAIARGMLTSCQTKNQLCTNQDIALHAIDHIETIKQFHPTHSRHPSGVAASFCNAHVVGKVKMDVLVEAQRRLVDLQFNGMDDPLKLLYRRLTEIRSSGAGLVASVTQRYFLTISALRAEKDKRPIKRIYEAEKDWGEK